MAKKINIIPSIENGKDTCFDTLCLSLLQGSFNGCEFRPNVLGLSGP